MSGQAQDLVCVKTPGAVTFCGSCPGGVLFALRNVFAVFFFLNPKNVIFQHKFTIELIDVRQDNKIVVRGRHVVVGTQEGIADYVLSDGLLFTG